MSHAEEFQIIHVNTSPMRWGQLPRPEVWAAHSDFLPKSTVWKGGQRRKFIWKNLTNTTRTGWQRSAATGISPAAVGTLGMVSGEQYSTSRFSFLKIEEPSIIIRETSDSSQFCLKIQISNFSRPSKTRKIWETATQEDPQATWLLNIVWYSEWDPGIKIGY